MGEWVSRCGARFRVSGCTVYWRTSFLPLLLNAGVFAEMSYLPSRVQGSGFRVREETRQSGSGGMFRGHDAEMAYLPDTTLTFQVEGSARLRFKSRAQRR